MLVFLWSAFLRTYLFSTYRLAFMLSSPLLSPAVQKHSYNSKRRQQFEAANYLAKKRVL